MKTKEEAKHTPGPWMMLQHPQRQTWVEVVHMQRISAAEGATIARLWGHSVKEAEANGNLVAAAPELLEAAKEVLETVVLHGLPWDTIDRLKAAIAKAERQ